MLLFYFILGCAIAALLHRAFVHTPGSSPSAKTAMTRKEAAQLLGVPENAQEDSVNDAYRRLIQKNHPDHGGTEYLASKINQARDVLLRR